MLNLSADEFDVSGTEVFLAKFPELSHIHVRKHGALIILESGPEGDRRPHARLRKVTKQWWTLEMPDHMERWNKTPHRALRNEVLQLLVDNYGWTLQP